jgi:hypothetical protein
MLRIITTLAAAGALLPAADAILASPGSPCASKCGNVQRSTPKDDLVCGQDNYAIGTGQTFKSCLECEITSDYSSGGRTDVESSLFNLRLTTSYCLWGFPENEEVESTPCTTSKACEPFRDAIQSGKKSGNLDPDVGGYDYCALWPVADEQDFEGCRDCLRLAEREYMANFFSVLQAGCEQQPKPGMTLGLDGDVFSTDDVQITEPGPMVKPDPSWFEEGPITLGGKVGIAIGGIALLLSLAGCGVVWNGKRRRRAYLRRLERKYGNQGWPSPQNATQGEMFETPISQRPLRGWDDSPMSAQTAATGDAEKPWGRYVSPYSSQYNSPVAGAGVGGEGPSMQWPAAALSPQREIGVALGGGDAGGDKWVPSAPAPASPAGDVKGKDRDESYEMHRVDSAGGTWTRQPVNLQGAPVLGHPGFGRAADSPPLRYSPHEG